MNEKSTGAAGLLAILLCAGVLIAAKHFSPPIYTVLLWIVSIVILLILVLVGAVFYLAMKKPKPDPAKEEKESGLRTLSQGRNQIMNIRRTLNRINSPAIKNSGMQVCSDAEKILSVFRQKPEQIAKNRSFFNFYLPTLASITEKYQRVEQSGTASSDLENKVLEHLNHIQSAFGRQYDSLFAGDLLDLSVEIEVMTYACKRDGLLPDADFVSDETSPSETDL